MRPGASASADRPQAKKGERCGEGGEQQNLLEFPPLTVGGEHGVEKRDGLVTLKQRREQL